MALRVSMTFAALGLGLLAGGIHLTTSRSCDIPLHTYNLTTLHPRLGYLEPSYNKGEGWQVILPGMRFPCAGYVTGWEAHTLVQSRGNYLDLLTHTITFQVWRPSLSDEGFTLVNSNKLTFSGLGATDNVTAIPERTDIAYFSFEETLSNNKQIHFVAGDVVGWYIPTQFFTNIPPLSVLFLNDSTTQPGHEDEERVDMYVLTRGSVPCVVCGVGSGGGSSAVEDAVVITSVLPLMSVKYAMYTMQESCEPQICETSMLPEVTPTMSTTTPTSVTRNTRQTGSGEPATWLDNRATSTVLLLTAAAVVGILIIQVIFCGYGIIKLKQLNKLLSNLSHDHKERSCNHGLQSCDTNFQSCDHRMQSCDHRVELCCDAEVMDRPCTTVERKNSYLVTPRTYCLESEIL